MTNLILRYRRFYFANFRTSILSFGACVLRDPLFLRTRSPPDPPLTIFPRTAVTVVHNRTRGRETRLRKSPILLRPRLPPPPPPPRWLSSRQQRARQSARSGARDWTRRIVNARSYTAKSQWASYGRRGGIRSATRTR